MPVLLFIFMVVAPLVVQAQTVAELSRELALRRVSVDSIAAVRVHLEEEVERLSAVVDSLKRGQAGNRAGGALEKALQQSLAVALALDACYRQEEALRVDVAQVQDRLRDAYDRDIAGLIRALSGSVDSAHVAQLHALQQARGALALPASETRREPRLSLPVARPNDGPEAIRQKAELMADVAAQVRQEMVETERRLKRLEVEQRLRGRVRTFAAELLLFDETLPEGRSVTVSERGVSADDKTEPTFGASEADRTGNPELLPLPPIAESAPVVGRERMPADASDLPGRGDGDALSEEIRRLQNQRTALMAQEKQVSARAKLLRQYLEALLGDAQ